VKSIAVGTLALGALGVSPVSASAQDVVGSWKMTAFYQKVVSTGEKRFTFGEKIAGRLILTKEGTFCIMSTKAERNQAGPAPTDEERVALFKSMFSFCGTYKADGSVYTMQADVAWTPGWLKGPHHDVITVNGKNMTLESKPFKSQLDGAEVVATTEYERE
jgi:hypothetical protein